MPHPTLRAIAFVLPLTAGCAAVIGADFSDATPLPAGADASVSRLPCDPVITSGYVSDPNIFLACSLGEQCVLNGTTYQCQAAGYRPDGEVCKQDSECKRGSRCDTTGFCRKNCYTNSDCPDLPEKMTACRIRPTTNARGMVGVCISFCDPVTNNTCFELEQCTMLGNDATECKTTKATVKLGAPCDSGECEVGTGCLGSNAVGYYCKKYCRVGTSCSDGAACRGLRDATIDGVEYGFCPSSDCDPVKPVCQGDKQCVFTTGSTEAHCVPTGAKKQELALCADDDECAVGLVCLTSRSVQRCFRPCRVTTCASTSPNADCPNNQACACTEEKPVIAGVEYGICDRAKQ